MNYDSIMNSICDEAIKRSEFYMSLSKCVENKDKLAFINKVVEKYKCDFDDAKIVCDYFIDKTPLPSTLSPQQQAHNQAVAREALNKPKCPTCNSTNIHKISTISKTTNTVMFGVFGTKRHKTFSCKNCGYEW